mgnify:CR=1 FL=1
MLGLGASLASGVAISSGPSYSNAYSAFFDGAGDYIDTNYQTDSTFQGSFTIACWMRPSDGQGTGVQTIFGAASSTNRVWVYLDDLGKLGIYHVSNNDLAVSGGTEVVFDNGAASDWVHIAVVVIKAGSGNTTYKFYKNKVALTTSTFAAVSDTNHAAFTIANDSGTLGSPYEGFIDEFGLWTNRLSAAAIDAIYNSGVSFDLNEPSGSYDANDVDDLELYYRFENNATDEGSAGSDGQVAGNTFFTTFLTPP